MAIEILKPLYSDAPKPYRDGKTPEERRFYSSYRWRKISERHRKTEPLCRECSKQYKVVVGTVVDHIVRRRDGGSDEEENLATLCAYHHNVKRKKESLL